jgi:hypothetical protein
MKDLEDPPSLECSAEVLGLEEKCLSSGQGFKLPCKQFL